MQAHLDTDGLVLEDTGPGPRLVPYKDILWAEIASIDNASGLVISYAKKSGKKGVKPVSDAVNMIGNQSHGDLVKHILDQAYAGSAPQRSVLVIVNPHSGKGLAPKIYAEEVEPILKAARCKIRVEKTEYAGHATAIAEYLDVDKYDMIVCASGDGIPHEVINGFYKRKDRARAFDKIIIAQTPSGSGNAMALSCLGTQVPSEAALEILKGKVVRADLMAVCSQENVPPMLSFLTQTYGVIAQADVITTWMRWVGQSRFDLGVSALVFTKRRFPCEIAVKYVAQNTREIAEFYKENRDESYEMPLADCAFNLKYYDEFKNTTNVSDISGLPGWESVDQSVCDNMGILWTGKMPYVSGGTNFFPAALPHDGAIDMVVTDVRTGVLKAADMLLHLDTGLHVWRTEVQHFKVEAFRMIPKQGTTKNPYLSIDGENFPVYPFQVEVLRGVMKTVMRGGAYKESGFLSECKKRL